jgi:anti-sigma B factor antagonist
MSAAHDGPSDRCRISGARRGDELFVTLAGEIDVACRERFSEFIDLEVEVCPGRLVLDMTDVTFVDSSGLAMLINAYSAVDANGGTVIIRSPNDQFVKLLEITRLTDLVTIEQGRLVESDQ